MTIKKYKTKKGIRWGFEIQLDKERFSKGGFPTRKEAQSAELQEEKRLRMSANDLDLTLLIIRRTQYIESNCTKAYLKENISTFNRLAKSLGRRLVGEVSRNDIENFLTLYPQKHGYNYALAKVNALFHYGVEREWTKHNPCIGIKRKATDKKMKYIPSKEDLEKVIGLASDEDRNFLLVLKNTMARVSEIYALTWGDVHFDDRSITLWTRKKRGGVRTPRTLPMTDELFCTLRSIEYKSEYVFTNPATLDKYEDKKKFLIGLCKRAKVKQFGFHAIRHYGASILAKKNVPLSDIQALLGHDNIITTAKYIQSIVGSTSESIHLLNE